MRCSRQEKKPNVSRREDLEKNEIIYERGMNGKLSKKLNEAPRPGN
jgi:hypothetical protein